MWGRVLFSCRSWPLALVAVIGGGQAQAAPGEFVDACYVRAEPASPAASGPGQSHLGLRRKGTQIVEVNVAVTGADGAVCSVAGVAKVVGAPGAEYLSLAVRPDGAARGSSTDVPCQLRIRSTATAVELAASEPSCRAQSLCGGLVQLDGQRFDQSGRVPDGGRGPCFAPATP